MHVSNYEGTEAWQHCGTKLRGMQVIPYSVANAYSPCHLAMPHAGCAVTACAISLDEFARHADNPLLGDRCLQSASSCINATHEKSADLDLAGYFL